MLFIFSLSASVLLMLRKNTSCRQKPCFLQSFVLQGDSTVVGTSKLRDLYERFEEDLGRRQERAKEARPKWDPPKTKLDEDPGVWHSGTDLCTYCCFVFLFVPQLRSCIRKMFTLLFYYKGRFTYFRLKFSFNCTNQV